MTTPSPRSAVGLRAVDRLEVNASWLLRLRWVAVVGQLVTVAVAAFGLGVALSVIPLLVAIAFTAATNVAFALWLRTHARLPESLRIRQDHWVLGGIIGLDLLSLTTLLYFSGGPANPFIIFYFVNLALAAVVLPSRSSWLLLLLALACLAFLFVDHVVMPELGQPLRSASDHLTLQHAGLVTAVALCAGVAIYFITRVTRELQQREEQLRIAEQDRARSERLEALATLAAGAGHELASPLSTIAVIASDLARHLDGTDAPASVLEDVRLIRSELDHCRHILDGMASSAGQATGEEMLPVSVRELIDETLDGLRRRTRVEVCIDEACSERLIVVPLIGAANSIRGLLRNGLDASPRGAKVRLGTSCAGELLSITVEDKGSGMPPDVLARAGEPFFTTKEPGKGMGLGLFLTQNLFQRLGGELSLDSKPNVGTTARLTIPLVNPGQ